MKVQINQLIIEIRTGSILSLDVDALVTSTDPGISISDELLQIAGISLQQEASLVGYVDIGSATITGAGESRFKKIIHAVGPRWGEASVRGKLANATWTVLELAENAGLTSLAMPAIATGSDGGYPIEACARIMMQQIVDFSFESLNSLRHIIIALETEQGIQAFTHELQRQLEDLDDTDDVRVALT
ncbi:MAG: macro domain-containing protein [Aggregatilineales bacterium]